MDTRKASKAPYKALQCPPPPMPASSNASPLQGCVLQSNPIGLLSDCSTYGEYGV